MFSTKPHEKAASWMSCEFDGETTLHKATIREELGTISEMRVEFEVPRPVSPRQFVGKVMRVHVELSPGVGRSFSGICVSVEARIDGKQTALEAEVRPWLWMLTRNQNSRIFQEKTVKEIIEQVFSDASFSDYEFHLNSSYDTRVYCVQYRESDFDFISRLMEQEGIYYYFESELNELDTFKMVICDDMGGHSAVPEYSTIEYCRSDSIGTSSDDQIFDWSLEQSVLTGKVTLDDFDFLNPGSDLTAASIQERGTHSYKSYEIYDTPGRQMIDGMDPTGEIDRGGNLARVRLESEVVRFETWRGRTGVRTMGVGRTFGLTNFPADPVNKEYLVTSAVHEIEADYGRHFQKLDKDRAVYACGFTAIPVTVPFRSRQRTRWPGIPGIQTAIVVGPSGEEIYTDQYGRIKVQFHWDRVGENNENSSCWVRVVTPWSGKKWGMIHIPRIGQEVVIQFEEGDPDRPLCTGMLYNQDTMPPYALPENKTQSGIRTDSSKDVSDAAHYNELMFEDKAGNELVRMQAQKDHDLLVKNKYNVTVGFGAMNYGDHADDATSMSTVVKDTVSELITDGDRFRKIEKGSETIEIKTDKTQIIEGKRTETVTGNDTTTVKSGNVSLTVNQGNVESLIKMGDLSTTLNMGNLSTLLKMGNLTTQLKLGNISTKADLGKITSEAMQSIELKVGGNSIKIDQTGVTIKGLIVKIQGQAMTEIKAPLTQVKGDALLVLKGGVTMIN